MPERGRRRFGSQVYLDLRAVRNRRGTHGVEVDAASTQIHGAVSSSCQSVPKNVTFLTLRSLATPRVRIFARMQERGGATRVLRLCGIHGIADCRARIRYRSCRESRRSRTRWRSSPCLDARTRHRCASRTRVLRSGQAAAARRGLHARVGASAAGLWRERGCSRRDPCGSRRHTRGSRVSARTLRARTSRRSMPQRLALRQLRSAPLGEICSPT